ncbi:MAG: glycosyltransferase family 2 protein [Cytophagales bacterium]|nr:glycosyltransferase family 2 protein [Cytophagales bacterium]MDW8383211.1 glycosyltransferase family 2 protein [Flammeovirgaceae bacterium]
MKKVYVLLLNYQNWQDTLECLDTLLKSDYPNYHVVIADNCSPNGAYEVLKEKLAQKNIVFNEKISELVFTFCKVSLVQTGYNGGFAFGNNFVIKHLINEDAYIWLLNPDTVVTDQTISAFVNCANAIPLTVWGGVSYSYTYKNKVVMYGGGTYNSWGIVRSIKKRKDAHLLRYIHGGNLFTHLSSFCINGFIAEDYFLYWEETDWCYHFLKRGGALRVCENAVVYDKIGGSVGKGYWQAYFMTYNKFRFFQKYFHQHLWKSFLTIFYYMIIEMLRSNRERTAAILQACIDFWRKRPMSRPE